MIPMGQPVDQLPAKGLAYNLSHFIISKKVLAASIPGNVQHWPGILIVKYFLILFLRRGEKEEYSMDWLLYPDFTN